ncbi:MAG TPA: sortase [Candidatus Limnocylindrales bacterium]
MVPMGRATRMLAASSLALAMIGPLPALGAFQGGTGRAEAPAEPPTVETARAAAVAGGAAAPDVAFSPSRTATAARLAANAPDAHERGEARPPKSPTPHSAPRGGRAGAVPYRGVNHMWMPALGIDRSVAWFPCSRSTPPGLAVYRWGCAGANNVYLLAHAYAAFEPLHDAYVSGRLRKGMTVAYADGAGRVHTYAIAWWRLTTPDHGGFAFAAQSRPSLTLQTCVGARSQYRLIVRFVQVS